MLPETEITSLEIPASPTGKSDQAKEAGNELVFSYMTLRNLIGFCGILLPVILALSTLREADDKLIENSISDYYYTSNGDILVVVLSILAVFLFTYNGYSLKEKLWTILAAMGGMGIAFSPTVTKYHRISKSIHSFNDTVPMIFGIERHLVFAMIFFISLSVMTLVFFPKGKIPPAKKPGIKTQKEKRNIVYKVCGWIMVGCLVVLVLYFTMGAFKKSVGDFPFIFLMEVIAIEAFGFSWITKGQTLWPDGQHYLKRAFRS